MDTTQQLKTGTTTVGIVAKDAIILGGDRRATAGHFIADRNYPKVQQISERMAITITGAISDIQLLTKYIRAELKLKDLKSGMQTSIKAAANLIAGFNYNALRTQGSIAGFMLAGYDHEGVHLYAITVDGVVREVTDYECTGSGTPFALAIIESQFTPGMPEAAAVTLAKKAVAGAMERDAGSGNGYDVFVITKGAIEHREAVTLRGQPAKN